MANGRKVVIVSAVRTPIGAFNGALSSLSATQLGAVAVKAAVERAGIAADIVDEVIMGNVLQGGVGQAPARQAALFAGLPEKVECTTVNKVCGSGLKAVMLAAQAIALGDADVIVAGGMESMSNAPYFLKKARTGYRMGNDQIYDLMIHDGLWDVYNDFHMGNAGEVCASECGFSREDQDEYAIESYKRAQHAINEGWFDAEIVPVEVPQRKGDPVVVSKDEDPFNTNFEKIPKLRPAFKKEGTVTAANAPSVNDGAAAVVVMSAEKAAELGITPLVRIVSHASAAQAPVWFTTAPEKAIRKALEKGNLTTDDIDLYEINEAFAVVALANNQKLGLDASKVNVHGGAVALGHPIGASGARILVTLIHAMNKYGKKRGVASLCLGGGGATAMVVERY
ncbi:MAG: acetyl-CoA C-acetyltransferase [Gemmatimonadetes bacterium]|nr:MAG: acetyl-CoA C-acetyltransferase [Gemmatimonadota bacterium]